MKKPLLLCLIAVALLLMVGCASTVDISDVTYRFQSGSYEAALKAYQAKQKKVLSAQGEIVYNLDSGILYSKTGDYKTSNDLLTSAETQISDEYTKSIMQGIGSYLINDNVIDYAGEDYEDIYINVFKAINYWTLGSAEDAMVELRRSAEKQSLLQSRYDKQWSEVSSYVNDNKYSVDVKHYKYSFSSSALSNYLMMVFSRSMKDYNTFDVAKKQVVIAFNAQPNLYNFKIPEFLQSENYDTGSSLARVNLVAFTGLSPIKEQKDEYMDMPNNTVGKISYPVLVKRPSIISSVKFIVNGSDKRDLELIEDMDAIIFDTFLPKQELAISKTILRSIVKNTATQVYEVTAKEEEKKNNSNTSLLFSLLSLFSQVGNLISEQADVRGAHFLPSKAWASGIDLAPGKYGIEIQFIGYSGSVVDSVTKEIDVKAGESNLVSASSPL